MKMSIANGQKRKVERRWNDKLVNLVHRQKGPASTKYFMLQTRTEGYSYSEGSTGGTRTKELTNPALPTGPC
jgi:hypothetical protein